MKMLLLVSALALLAGRTLMFPTRNFNHVIDLIDKPNKTLNERAFVEKVLRDGCENDFFCKVHDVLKKDAAFQANRDGEMIIRNLEHSINGLKFNCSVVSENGTTVGQMEVGQLLQSLKFCIQKRNLIGAAKAKQKV